MFESTVQVPNARTQPEVDLLLSCSRTQLTPEISSRIRAALQKELNWMALVRLALRHDVMPLLYRSLQQVSPDSVPQEIFGPVRARYESQSRQARRLAEELVRILPLFEEEGILAVPYKGPVLAQRLYGDLSLREFSDLDIMILERDVPRAQKLIRSCGYELSHLEDMSKFTEYVQTQRELQFCRSDGTLLELHWRFATRLACVKHDPERFLERFETISLAGMPVRVRSLPLEIYILILAMHATKHKWGQLKLICDIAEILGHAELDWRYVLAVAGDLGLKRMLALGILLADDSLGVTAPAELAQGLKIDRTTRALAAEVYCSLFEEADQAWHEQADFPFQFKIRERLRDRAGMLYRNLPSKLQPEERDRRFLQMPESLSPLYYLVRPLRLTWGKKDEKKRRKARPLPLTQLSDNSTQGYEGQAQ
jgi:Uncharacterised nucleotidyltransferase